MAVFSGSLVSVGKRNCDHIIEKIRNNEPEKQVSVSILAPSICVISSSLGCNSLLVILG